MSTYPPPRPYFPVATPHRLPGAQTPLGAAGAGEHCIELDTELAEYVEAKRRSPEPVQRTADGDAGAEEQVALDELRRLIALGDSSLAHRLDPRGGLDAAVAAIQEDVVLMRRDARAAKPGSARAVYLNVCFPTGWCPPCMNGRAFTAIHGPVPALHAFGAGRGASARHLFDTTGGATVRFVWTLTPDAALDRRRCARRRHDDAPAASWAEATRAWFRVERQVIVPLSATLGMFLIRIYRRDVATLAPAERRRVWESIAGMEPDLAKYKGFAGHEDKLRRLLLSGL